MRAVVRDVYGGPDVLRIDDIPMPVPTDDGVLVRVRATSINDYDWHLLTGQPAINRIGALRRVRRLRRSAGVGVRAQAGVALVRADGSRAPGRWSCRRRLARQATHPARRPGAGQRRGRRRGHPRRPDRHGCWRCRHGRRRGVEARCRPCCRSRRCHRLSVGGRLPQRSHLRPHPQHRGAPLAVDLSGGVGAGRLLRPHGWLHPARPRRHGRRPADLGVARQQGRRAPVPTQRPDRRGLSRRTARVGPGGTGHRLGAPPGRAGRGARACRPRTANSAAPAPSSSGSIDASSNPRRSANVSGSVGGQTSRPSVRTVQSSALPPATIALRWPPGIR